MEHGLAQHVGRDECYAALGHVESPDILDRVEADLQARGEDAMLVDHAAFQLHAAIEHHLGQDQQARGFASGATGFPPG